jgi:hypothetical protein
LGSGSRLKPTEFGKLRTESIVSRYSSSSPSVFFVRLGPGG